MTPPRRPLGACPDTTSATRRPHRLLRLLLAFLAVPGIAAAQAVDTTEQLSFDPTELSLEELMAIDLAVTSVSKKSQRLKDTPAAVYVITQEDIRRSTATSIPELLRAVPGIQVARINSSSYAVSARGFNGQYSNKLLVLVDGRSIYAPLFSGVFWEYQDTALDDIERIEVIRGPGAAVWGSNAVNGVINIITKRAEDTQGGLVTAIAGTEERHNLTLRQGGELQDGHWRVWAKAHSRDSLQLNGGGDAGDEARAERAGFRVDFNPRAGDEITVSGSGFTHRSDYTADVVDVTAPPTTRLSMDDRGRGGSLMASWRRELSDESEVSLQTYYDHTSV